MKDSKEYHREYKKRPEYKAYMKEYYLKNKDKIINNSKIYLSKPEIKARRKAYMVKYIFEQGQKYKDKRHEYYLSHKKEMGERAKQHLLIPEVRERRRRYSREYNHRDYVQPKIKAYAKEYGQRPSVKIRSRERARRYWNKPEVKARTHFKRQVAKDIVYHHYGGYRCSICGETRVNCLSIDHVNGGGNKHRKEIGGANLYRWLIRNNFPSGFRVLCMNCNHIFGREHHKEFYNGS